MPRPRAAGPAHALALALAIHLAPAAGAAELVAPTPSTWDRYAPAGKEADAIYGDYALANGDLIAVVGNPVRGRNANMTVRGVGGAVIDLTRRARPNDQLGAFYPGGPGVTLKFAGVDVAGAEVYDLDEPSRLFARARSVSLRLVAEPRHGMPDVSVVYTLRDGWPYLLVETTFANPGDAPVSTDLLDLVRADKTFESRPEGTAPLFWAYDKWFGQAYGVLAGPGLTIRIGRGHGGSILRYDSGGKTRLTLAPGERRTVTRRLIPGANMFEVRAAAEEVAGKAVRLVVVRSQDTSGQSVPGADVVVKGSGGVTYAWGVTDETGKLAFALPDGHYDLTVSSPGRGRRATELEVSEGDYNARELDVALDRTGEVEVRVTDDRGEPIPCKVQFAGRRGTPDPDFGPVSGDGAVKNVVYAAAGRFRRPIPPGRYEAIVSRGPEYDAGFFTFRVGRGELATVQAKLTRSVQTPGWVSADFHSHASPSGDNTSSQRGRVENLLCEHVEFAPCTEHNRVSSYVPHLEALGALGKMATCPGIELTNEPLPLSHQNAFPMVLRPNTQDGGAPTRDDDPEVQIERLASWDQNSEKLVQVNHPDLGWMFFDRNGDGRPDDGYRGMVGRMDVIEVHPPHLIFRPASEGSWGRNSNNAIFNWLQLLNQGHRIPGVVNTDAHENFHGSGWLRNYLKSPTDDPSKIDALEVVRAAERGHLVMTNGPFLDVSLRAEGPNAPAPVIPGDDLALPGGKARLSVRVQCPNWFDVDRVQVFLNGRPDKALNFTRPGPGSASARAEGSVRFALDVPLALAADTHVIVAAVGEHSKLGPVMGPDHQNDLPVAVSNPIFVDVDGGGFTANEDTLGTNLPVKAGAVAPGPK